MLLLCCVNVDSFGMSACINSCPLGGVPTGATSTRHWLRCGWSMGKHHQVNVRCQTQAPSAARTERELMTPMEICLRRVSEIQQASQDRRKATARCSQFFLPIFPSAHSIPKGPRSRFCCSSVSHSGSRCLDEPLPMAQGWKSPGMPRQSCAPPRAGSISTRWVGGHMSEMWPVSVTLSQKCHPHSVLLVFCQQQSGATASGGEWRGPGPPALP